MSQDSLSSLMLSVCTSSVAHLGLFNAACLGVPRKSSHLIHTRKEGAGFLIPWRYFKLRSKWCTLNTVRKLNCEHRVGLVWLFRGSQSLCLMSTGKLCINTTQFVYTGVLHDAGFWHKAHRMHPVPSNACYLESIFICESSNERSLPLPHVLHHPERGDYPSWVQVTNPAHMELFDHIIWSLFNFQSTFFGQAWEQSEGRLWWAWM